MSELSREELMVEFNRMFTRWGGLVGKEMQAYEQLKSLVEQKPIPPDELNDFVERWTVIMETHNDLWSMERRIKDMLKEYDELGRG